MKELLNCISNGTKYFPCFTALMDSNSNMMEFQWNSKGNSDLTHRHISHAEYLLINKIKKRNDQIIMIQTMPPCLSCLRELEKLKKPIKIIYLFDQWHKLNKRPWQTSEYIIFELLDSKYSYISKANFKLLEKRYNKHGHKWPRKRLIKIWGNFENILH